MITSSSYERIRICPASAALPQIRQSSEHADKGNEGHAALRDYVNARRSGPSAAAPEGWEALCHAVEHLAQQLRSEVAFAYNVETGRARILGYDIGRDYRLEPCEVAGTADLVGAETDAAIIIDAKTGHGDVTPAARNGQLALLALMACRALNKERAKVALLRCPEDGTPRWDWHELEPWDLDAIAEDVRRVYAEVSLAAEAVRAGRVPDVTEGPHCKYCPAVPCCPAKTMLIRRLASGAEVDELETLKPLSPEVAGIAWRRLQAIKALTRALEAAIMAALDEYGSLPLPEGGHLRRVIRQGNESLDGKVTWRVMSELYGRDIADVAVEYKATKRGIKDALRMVAPKGGAAEAERRVLDEIRRRGGASRGTTTRVEEIVGSELDGSRR